MELPISHTLTTHTHDGVVYYAFPSLEALPFIRHGFSTRLGGVSEGIYASMNLGYNRGDRAECVTENYRRIAAAMDVRAEDMVLAAQTHTANIRTVTAADRGRGITRERGYTDVDGLLTADPNVVLCTHYADCVPLFFVDPVRRVIGMAHAGWRGTVAEIGARMIEKMTAEFRSDPADVLVGIAPSIGPCCFEVDEPVWAAFAKHPLFDSDCYTDDGNGKYHINLWEFNRRVLIAAGVSPSHITVTDLCTVCHPEVLWSHRATHGERGSAAGFLSLR
ncbi:MAG: peptidoglycan editing factor PgeF [Clostridia bacterium]|nr:peptidoglycan editing factor PgeF [Clostridia bacterium]